MSKGNRKKQPYHNHAPRGGADESDFFPKTIRAELLATTEERSATSESLYFDHGYRIANHPPFLEDSALLERYERLFEKKVKGKRVLFIGASLGLGILPMMAVRNGSTRVVSVDDSAVVTLCQQLATDNGFSDDRLTFIRGNMLHPDLANHWPADCGPNSFDVLYCDWMSTLVVNNTPRLAECLYAREKYLKKGGEILPRCAELHAFGVSDYECFQSTQEWWSNVYGFKMDTMRDCVLTEPFPGNVWPESQKTDISSIFKLNIFEIPFTITEEAVNARVKTPAEYVAEVEKSINWGPFPLTLTSHEDATLHYITVYASYEYDDDFKLSPAPGDSNAESHFTQTSLALPIHVPVLKKDLLNVNVSLTPDSKSTPTRLFLKLDVDTHGTSLIKKVFSQSYVHAEYR